MKALGIVVIVFMPIMVVLFSFMTVILDESFFYTQLKENNVYSTVPNADYVYHNLSNYLTKGGELDQSLYTGREIIHLEDVRDIVAMASYSLVIMLLLSIGVTAYFFVSKEFRALGNAYLMGGVLALVISVAIAVAAIMSFSDLFVVFHKLLFSNNFWQLPASTMLIQLFPEEFFVAASRRIITSCLLLSAFSVVKGLVLRIVEDKI